MNNTNISKSSIEVVEDLKPGYVLGQPDTMIIKEMARYILGLQKQEPVAIVGVGSEHKPLIWLNDAPAGTLLYAAPVTSPDAISKPTPQADSINQVPIYQYQSEIYNEENGESEWYWDDCDFGFYSQYAEDQRRVLYSAPVPPAAIQPGPTHEAASWQVDEAIARMESEGDMIQVPRGLLGAATGAIRHPGHEVGVTLGALRHYCFRKKPVPAEPVSSPEALPAESEYGYFAFWPWHGEEFFKRREDAIAMCQKAIEEYRIENADEGVDDTEGDTPGHRIFTHEWLSERTGFISTSIDCGHKPRREMKLCYVTKILSVLKNYKSYLEDFEEENNA